MDLKSFEAIDEDVKLLVFGYSRRIQRQLPRNNVYYNIPSTIYMICIMYYVTFKDEWNPDLKQFFMTINGNRLSSKPNSWGSGRAFLQNIVSKGRHEWIFKIHKFMHIRSGASIGIWNMKHDPKGVLNCGTGTDANRAYLYLFTDRKLNIHEKKYGLTGYNTYGKKCEPGAIISIHVDFNDLTVWYTINGRDCGKAFDIKPGEYSVFFASASMVFDIELLKYDCTFLL